MTYKSNRIETVCENLRVLDERAENNLEQMRLCAKQMCGFLTDDGTSLGPLWAKLNAIKVGPAFKVTLCRCICEKAEYRAIAENILRGDSDIMLDAARRKIAYVRNKRNDRIFLEFSKKVDGAKAHYCATFADACETVFNNVCEFCILPIQNGREGKIYSFYTMLDRYELKIAYIFAEEDTDSQESVTFALASRTLCMPDERSTNLRFEFSLIGENVGIVSDITQSVKELGGVVSDVGTLPVAYDQPRRKFYLSADIPAEGIIPLTMYLSMENVGFEILGLYQV